MAMQAGGPNDRQRGYADALARAMRAIQDGHPADAERLAGEILKANAGHQEATKIAGYALLMQGRAAEAVAPLEKVARSSRNPEIETQLAIALRQSGDSDKAMVWLKRAVKRTPPFAPAFYELGCVLQAQKKFGEAIAVFQQGIAVAPMMTDLWLQLGLIYEAQRDRANARAAYARVLTINPGNSEAMREMAPLLMRDGDFAQAAELLRRAIAVDPDDKLARIALGNCMLELGQPDTAYACLRAAAIRGAQLHGLLRAMLLSGHSRFWLRPSSAAKFFKGEGA